MNSKIKRWSVFVILFLGIVVTGLYALRGGVIPKQLPKVKEYAKWDPELVEFVRQMPVQDDGRLKPFSSWASFTLYGIHSKRKIKFEVDGETVVISPTEWMLDTLFRPEVADRLPIFSIDDSRIAEDLNIRNGSYTDYDGNEVYKKKRDLYSWNEIYSEDFINACSEQVVERDRIERTGEVLKGLDAQKANLVSNAGFYKVLTRGLDLVKLVTDGIERKSFEEQFKRELSNKDIENLANVYVRSLYASFMERMLSEDKTVSSAERERWSSSHILDFRMMPSADASESKWISFHEQLRSVFTQPEQENVERVLNESIAEWVHWIKLDFAYKDKGDKGLLEAFKLYSGQVEKRMEARGESLNKVKSEVVYYNRMYYDMALGYFSLGVMFMIGVLPFPKSIVSKILVYLSIVCAAIGAGYVIWGIVHRSEIMARYPLGNLYDTILLITAACVVILLVMELLSRKVFCIGAGVTLGVMGMLLAYRFEIGEGVDNMKPLAAVLNSNYWLATHVMCITIGYAGGLVASVLSIFYVVARVTGIDEGNKKLRRVMTRMAYGAACFTLFFSLVGTILGGVWANDSWGRFWGWDPKENGALMIVLWFLAMLHARLAGYVKEWGIHIFMILGANVIAFSWFGVNFLATGLHNYGFASGGDGEWWLNVYYLINTGISLVAFGFAWYDWELKRQKKRAKSLEKVKDEGEEPSHLAST